jgi:hypothetical protein
MQISLVAVICANILNPESCVKEFVTDNSQSEMSMSGCMGMEGMVSAVNFAIAHPIYKNWKVAAWHCVLGKPPASSKMDV